jgi:hypothetical protein
MNNLYPSYNLYTKSFLEEFGKKYNWSLLHTLTQLKAKSSQSSGYISMVEIKSVVPHLDKATIYRHIKTLNENAFISKIKPWDV